MRSFPRLKAVFSALAIFALTLGVEGSLNGLSQGLFAERIASEWSPKNTNSKIPNTTYSPQPITIIAFGDLMLDRFVWTLMQRHGLDYPFEHFPELLETMGVSPPGLPPPVPSAPPTDYRLPATDFLFANLEGPISDTPYVNPGTAMVFNFRPDVISILQKYGFNLLSIANNHNYDMGEKGVRQTRERLSEAGIHWVGESKGIAAESQWTTRCGKAATLSPCTTLTFFAFNDTLQDRLDFDQAAALIREAEQGSEGRPGADFTIVSIHWGVEYNQAPTQKQVENAHKLVDAGADIILGHHPHVIQKPANLTPNEHGTMFAEWYSPRIPSPLQTTDYPLQTSPRPIYYSLGNFVFDQYFSKAVQEGLGLTLTLQKSTDPTVPATLQVKETVFDIVRSQVRPRPGG